VVCLAFFIGCGGKYDENEIKPLATQIVKKVARYIEIRGVPHSLLEVKLPYKLKPCRNDKKIKLCEKGAYYFYKEGAYGVIVPIYETEEELTNSYPLDKKVTGFLLFVMYKHSKCGYIIYENGKLKKDYLNPFSCGSTSQTFGRQ